MTLRETADAPAEVARSANGLLREFRVERRGCDTPQDDTQGHWAMAGPETRGDLTAIGYYFGKKLQGELKQPVGIVNATWGGTFIEAWTSAETLAKDPALQAGEEERRRQMAD